MGGGGAGLHKSPDWICRYFHTSQPAEGNFSLPVPEGTVQDRTVAVPCICFQQWTAPLRSVKNSKSLLLKLVLSQIHSKAD